MASSSKKIKLHNFKEIKTAFKSRVSTWRHVNVDGTNKDVKNYMQSIKSDGINLIKSALGQHRGLKVNLASYVTLENLEKDRELGLHLKNVEIYQETNLDEFWDSEVVKLGARLEAAEVEGSGFSLKQINSLQININKYTPLKASSYFELPDYVTNKRDIINVNNEDNQCFKWAILAALYPAKNNPQRVSNYIKHENKINMGSIPFPVKISDIKKFEKLNKISVNVFSYDTVWKNRLVKRRVEEIESAEFYPLYYNKVRYEKEVDLLF